MTPAGADRDALQAVLADLEGWLERHDWRGYEPHDGLSSPLRRLLGQNRTALLALKQVVLKSPWNLRPLLGVPRGTSPEALGFFARGYIRRYRAEGHARDQDRAREMLARMLAAAEPGYAGLCWGNKFDYITRFFYLPAGTPIIVWTAHNAHVLVDAADALGDASYLEAARSACRFIVDDLPRHAEGETVCLSYVPIGDHPVHNANVLGAALLARVGVRTGDADLVALARRAMAYTVAHQHADGSWWYGEAGNLRWVDGFHTGYVLESLAMYRDASGDATFDAAVDRGLAFYRDRFFTDAGAPRYFADRTYPHDIQCAAQAVETMLAFRHAPGALDLARRVATWTIAHMREPDGSFCFRRYRYLTNHSPLLHWGQATMFSALTGLLEASREA